LCIAPGLGIGLQCAIAVSAAVTGDLAAEARGRTVQPPRHLTNRIAGAQPPGDLFSFQQRPRPTRAASRHRRHAASLGDYPVNDLQFRIARRRDLNPDGVENRLQIQMVGRRQMCGRQTGVDLRAMD
jgi:hypothetical protein